MNESRCSEVNPEIVTRLPSLPQPLLRYVRVLGAFYLRLVGTPADIYQYLEPLFNDYRKIRTRLTQGAPQVPTHPSTACLFILARGATARAPV